MEYYGNVMKMYFYVLMGCLLLTGCSFDTPSVNKKTETQETPPFSRSGSPSGENADVSGKDQPTQTEKPQAESTIHSSSQTPMQDTQKTYASAPTMQIDVAKKYVATLKTELGDIEVELYSQKTPVTVNNFVFLAKEKFYDHVIFHRTIKGFMIQGGDPTGTGMGGPGYKFNDEPFSGEYTRGTVAMANAGLNTNGSQFFIMHADMPLPKNYVIFGAVTKGMDVVDMIAGAPTQPGGEGSKPVKPIEIRTVTITETH